MTSTSRPSATSVFMSVGVSPQPMGRSSRSFDVWPTMARCGSVPRWPARSLFFSLAHAWQIEARAWGKLGHRAASTVVENHLTPAAAAAIRDLLEPGETLADASLWADEHRRAVVGSGAWHYVNVPITESQYDARFCPSTGCVVSKIDELRDILRSAAATHADKQQALRFLVHFAKICTSRFTSAIGAIAVATICSSSSSAREPTFTDSGTTRSSSTTAPTK